MMHHPPDWLGDNDELDEALWNYCALHLLGHKHRQRYHAGPNGVRLAAGAVNPSRTEKNWEPGYNLVRLQIFQEGAQYFLKIESYLRSWQDNPDRFVAKKTEDDGDVFVHTVTLRRRPSPVPTTNLTYLEEKQPMEGIPNKSIAFSGGTESPVNVTSQRNIVFDFWQLTPSERRKMMQGLNLLEPSDDDLPETQRYRLAFNRARERGVIDQLEESVNRILTEKGRV